MQPKSEKEEWEAALSRMFEDENSFAATGPRREGTWPEDTLAVMGRDVPDPRGWKRIDEESWPFPDPDKPYYPFRPPTPELIAEQTHPIDSLAGHQLLVLLTDDRFRVGSFPFHGKNEAQYRADALTVLARYGPDAKFFTTSQDAKTTTSPDFSREARHGYRFSNYIAEIGMIVVSKTEVGVFWSFDAEAEFE